MTKTIDLPDGVYDDLAAVQEELEHMAKKPMSPSMTLYLLMSIYRAYIGEPCARDAFQQRLAASDLLSPEEFDAECEGHPIQPKPKVRAKPKPKKSS